MLQMGIESLIIRTLKKCLRAAAWLTIFIVPLGGNLASAQSIKPRPFYIIAHRVNSPALVEEALRQGANAIEIDVRCDASAPGLSATTQAKETNRLYLHFSSRCGKLRSATLVSVSLFWMLKVYAAKKSRPYA